MPVSISFYRTARSSASGSDPRRFHGVARHDPSRVSVGRKRAMGTAADASASAALPCEFFVNIWGPSPVRRRRARPLVDISQVAHVLTTLRDFRDDYAPLPMQLTNLWDDPGLDRPDTAPHEFMSPIQSSAGSTSGEDDESSGYSDLSAAFRSPAAGAGRAGGAELLQRGRPAQVVLPTGAGASEASGAQLTKIKPGGDPQGPAGADADAAAAGPRALKHGGVVFSSAFGDPADWNWAARLLLALHEPVRHALFVMDRFLDHCHAQYAQLGDPPPAVGAAARRGRSASASAASASASAVALESLVADFFAWFKTCFVELLRSQNELKTHVLLPLVSLKADTKREVLDRYREAFRLVEQTQQLERALVGARGACSRSAWALRLDVLRREARTLRTALLGALALEDRALLPALGNTFTELTFFRYVAPRVFRAARSKRVLVPWVLERSKIWGGAREHAALLALLPFSARLLYRKVWRPFFVSNVAVAMNKLLDVADGASASASASVSASAVALAVAAASAGAADAGGDRCGVQ